MIDGIANELRAFAQRPAGFACEWSDQDLSYALAELAVDLAAKAEELNRRFERYRSQDSRHNLRNLNT
jgi:hypothetical protein